MTKRPFVPILLSVALAGGVPAAAATDGKGLYESKCAMCHGMDGVSKSMATGSKNLNDPAWKQSVTSDLIVRIIHDGKGRMKGLGDALSREQSAALAAYVLTLAK